MNLHVHGRRQRGKHAPRAIFHVSNVTTGLLMVKCPVAPFIDVHQHNEVEIALLACGEVTVVFGNSRVRRTSGRLSVMWGAIPHGSVRVTSGRPVGYSLHIPLSQFISWQLPAPLVTAVLQGRCIVDAPQTEPCSDLALMKFWHKLMQSPDAATREIVLGDLQTRLRRLASTMSSRTHDDTTDTVPRETAAPASSSTKHLADRATNLFEKMLAEIHARHQKNVSVAQVARAAGISPTHAMQVFRTVCGTTIHEYVTRSRIYTAQRLLVTTDDKVTAIGRASGFHSVDCFYDAFNRICGMTPKQFRKQAQGTSG